MICLVQMQLIYDSAAFWFVGKALPGPGEVFLCLFTQSDLGAAGPRRFPYFFHPGPDLQASVLRAHTLVWAQSHILHRVAVILWMPWTTSLTFTGLKPFSEAPREIPWAACHIDSAAHSPASSSSSLQLLLRHSQGMEGEPKELLLIQCGLALHRVCEHRNELLVYATWMNLKITMLSEWSPSI